MFFKRSHEENQGEEVVVEDDDEQDNQGSEEANVVNTNGFYLEFYYQGAVNTKWKITIGSFYTM